MKKALILLISMAVAASAAAGTLYRIELRGQAPIIARDEPAPNGSVLLFHRQVDGRLTGVPREDVVSVTPVATSRGTSPKARVTATTAEAPADGKPLQPGESLVLGPTGGDGSTREAGAEGANATAAGRPGAAMAPGAAGYGGPVGPDGVPVGAVNAPGTVNPNLALQPPAATTVGSDGVPRAASGPPPTIDPVTGRPPTSPPVAGSTANPAGSTPPTTTSNPAGATAPVTTTNPAGSTPQGTTLQPVQPGTASQPQTPPQQTGTTQRPNSGAAGTNRGAGTTNNSTTTNNSPRN
ncbi:MAG: hypothetical protein ABR576_11820 [Thermoanaerobaculia bacterium]